jgi:hypothetical protein
VPTAGGWNLIDIGFTYFVDIVSAGDGVAVYVEQASVTWIHSDAFVNCRTGTATSILYGGGAFLRAVLTGTSVNDSCASECQSYAGSFVVFDAGVAVTLKGLSVFEC